MSAPFQLAVLCQNESWYLHDLQRAAAEHRLGAAQALSFETLSSRVAGAETMVAAGEHALHDFPAVLVRTMPAGSLEQVVFRMDALAQLEARGVCVLNPPKAIEAAVDKYLTTARLQRAGLPTPETHVCQDWRTAMAAWDALDGDAVLKPIFGGEGRGVTRIADEAIAARTFRLLEQLGAVIYLQAFVPQASFDVRVLCLGEQCWAMKRSNPHDWRSNISRGATASPYAVDERMRELALAATRAVGAEFAGVDLLPDGAGGWWLLEVNAVPGWRALARATGVDIALQLWRYMARRIAND